MERSAGPRITRRGLILAGALGVGAAGGTYAVARSGLVELPGVPGIPGLAGPTPPELHIDPQPLDWRVGPRGRDLVSSRYDQWRGHLTHPRGGGQP